MTNDGFTLDAKRNPIDGSEIPDIINRFHNLSFEKTRSRLDKSFLVPVEEIREKNYILAINSYKERAKENKAYRKISEIIFDIEKTRKQVTNAFDEIKKMLGE